MRRIIHDKNDKTERIVNKAVRQATKNQPMTKKAEKQQKEIDKYIIQKLNELEAEEQAPDHTEGRTDEGLRKEYEIPGKMYKATQTDKEKQYAKDLLRKELIEKEKISKMKAKEWIPITNESFIKRYLKIGPDYKHITNEEANGPILLLMRIDGEIEIFENVKEGMFKIKIVDNNDKEEVKGIILEEKKLHRIPYGNGEYLKVWICHENEATPYPHEVQHDSLTIVKFVEKIILNFSALDDNGPKGWMAWIVKALPWIAGVAIVGYIIWYMGIIPGFGKEVIKAAANATINATNTTIGQGAVPLPP